MANATQHFSLCELVLRRKVIPKLTIPIIQIHLINKTFKGMNGSPLCFSSALMFYYVDQLIARVHRHSIAMDCKGMK